MTASILVAGVGNIFLSDDGFGVEVANRLAAESFPEDVRVAEFGIRGIHLAYELLEGYRTAILVDALSRGDAPGTVYVFEPDLDAPAAPLPDGHTMHPRAVIDYLRSLGGPPVRFLVVGCEPASLDEGIGLSEPVTAAVEPAVGLVHELVERELAVLADLSPRPALTGQAL
ncbi:MAG: hydrogenase maturation protease [Chloroflexota bacterium]